MSIRYASEETLRRAPYIAALSFGIGPDASPGKSNERMATIMQNVREKYGCEIVAQHEIASILDEVSYVVKEHKKIGPDGKPVYLDTYEGARQITEYFRARRCGIAEPIILVAHPHHWPRCAAVFSKLGFWNVWATETIKSIPYDSDSTQVWTRSPWLFRPREVLAMLDYRRKGYV